MTATEFNREAITPELSQLTRAQADSAQQDADFLTRAPQIEGVTVLDGMKNDTAAKPRNNALTLKG